MYSVLLKQEQTFCNPTKDTMTRRKKAPGRPKRQQITDSSGWTHVIKGPPGTIDPSITNTRLGYGKSTETKYTLETYLARFRQHYAPIWRESTCFEHISRIFEQDILPAEKNITVTQCICLGLGSMTAGSESSSYQLAALVSMLEILCESPTDAQTNIYIRIELCDFCLYTRPPLKG